MLIALFILGVIATFTIPKVLVAQSNVKYNAMAKEVAGMLSGAFTAYQLNNSVSSSTKISGLTANMNYVRVLTSGSVDDTAPWPSQDCSDPSVTCLKLHNGGVMVYFKNESFSGTASTNVLCAIFDPDGQVSTTKAVAFLLYPNGKITSSSNGLAGSTSSLWGYAVPNTNEDPPWFSW